jgi:hypothetical protein
LRSCRRTKRLEPRPERLRLLGLNGFKKVFREVGDVLSFEDAARRPLVRLQDYLAHRLTANIEQLQPARRGGRLIQDQLGLGRDFGTAPEFAARRGRRNGRGGFDRARRPAHVFEKKLRLGHSVRRNVGPGGRGVSARSRETG